MELSVKIGADATIFQVMTDRASGHGGIVWDAALVLAAATLDLMCATSGLPLRVLELGAGCGLPGIALAITRKADVILTDHAALVPLLQYNCDLSAHLISKKGSSVRSTTLEFGQRLRRLPQAMRPPYDIVLASDVLGCGDVGAFEGLLKTLEDIFAASNVGGHSCVVLMTYRPRAPWEGAFFEGVRARGWKMRLRQKWTSADVMVLKSDMLQTNVTPKCEAQSQTLSQESLISNVESAVSLDGAHQKTKPDSVLEPPEYNELEVAVQTHEFSFDDVPGSETTPSSSVCCWGGGSVELWELTAASPT